MVAGEPMKPTPAREQTPSREFPKEGEGPREFVKYTFYKVRPEWWQRPREQRSADKAEFAALLNELQDKITLRTYTLVGIRGDTEFMTWAIADSVEAFVAMGRRARSTGLGRHLDLPYSYLAMRRMSVYLQGHEHAGQEGAGTARSPVGGKYLFVYPFTKKREWYALPFEERRRIMGEHFRIGHKYPRITIHTGYSFGLDDQEFMLGFEGDSPGEFLDLVMELRSSGASRYTAMETPIFTCLFMEPEAVMATLGD
jgi:chlorite dismutase